MPYTGYRSLMGEWNGHSTERPENAVQAMAPDQACAQHDSPAPERTPGNIDNARSNHEDPGRPRRGASPIDRGTGARQRRTCFQRRAVFHWLGSEPRAGATWKPWKCCHPVPHCPAKKAWRRNPKAQLPHALAQGIFTCAEARDNTRKKHTPRTVVCAVGKRAQRRARGRRLSPPRCRSGDRLDGPARTWSVGRIPALARKAAPKSVHVTALRARLKSEVRFSAINR